MRITEPGLYPDISTTDYHADPCPDPSLTQSIAKTLLDKSPLHAWWRSPRLNPQYVESDEKKFDVGTVAHKHLLGRGRDIAVIEADDYRTKAAQTARAEAITAGKSPVLAHQNERAIAMVRAVREQLRGAGPDAFREGQGEVMIAWRDGGIWCRSLIDWLTADKRVVWDLKTTLASAAPLAIPMKMAADGWPIQAAMHERGLNARNPENAGRRKHRFVCVECEEPYALTVTEIPEGAMTMGRKMLEMAMHIWRDCVTTNRWPGYPTDIQRPEYPAFREAQWLAREIEAEQRKQPDNILMAG